MTGLIKAQVDVATGQTTEVPLSSDEIAAREAMTAGALEDMAGEAERRDALGAVPDRVAALEDAIDILILDALGDL